MLDRLQKKRLRKRLFKKIIRALLDDLHCYLNIRMGRCGYHSDIFPFKHQLREDFDARFVREKKFHDCDARRKVGQSFEEVATGRKWRRVILLGTKHCDQITAYASVAHDDENRTFCAHCERLISPLCAKRRFADLVAGKLSPIL
ncbi:hypothetical protein TomTYG45_37840 [Sphingobium sp. TomTYG45]